jgi:threonine aldolase
MGHRLREALSANSEIEFVHPTDANEIFVRMPRPVLENLRESGVQFYENWRTYPDRHHRMVTSFATTLEDIERVRASLQGSARRGK